MKFGKVCFWAVAAMWLGACAASAPVPNTGDVFSTETADEEVKKTDLAETSDDGVPERKPGAPKILIAYFTRLDNTDREIDEILRGGGPYGSLGNSLEEADTDAISSASIQLKDGRVYGNTEILAQMIQKYLGGELFSIQTVQDYPTDYDELIDRGGKEKNQSERPQLESHVEDMEAYDVILLGFPIWWYDLPMPVYSFLEEYDFSGKTVIPFATSAGSGFSGTIGALKKILPDVAGLDSGLHIQMGDVAEADGEVAEWVKSLEVKGQ